VSLGGGNCFTTARRWQPGPAGARHHDRCDWIRVVRCTWHYVVLSGGGNYLERETLAAWASRSTPPRQVRGCVLQMTHHVCCDAGPCKLVHCKGAHKHGRYNTIRVVRCTRGQFFVFFTTRRHSQPGPAGAHRHDRCAVCNVHCAPAPVLLRFGMLCVGLVVQELLPVSRSAWPPGTSALAAGIGFTFHPQIVLLLQICAVLCRCCMALPSC
jgi:hypothetical protein